MFWKCASAFVTWLLLLVGPQHSSCFEEAEVKVIKGTVENMIGEWMLIDKLN